MHGVVVWVAVVEVSFVDMGFSDVVEVLHGGTVHEVSVLVDCAMDLVVHCSLVLDLSLDLLFDAIVRHKTRVLVKVALSVNDPRSRSELLGENLLAELALDFEVIFQDAASMQGLEVLSLSIQLFQLVGYLFVFLL